MQKILNTTKTRINPKIITLILVLGYVLYWFETSIEGVLFGDIFWGLAIIFSLININVNKVMFNKMGLFTKSMLILTIFNILMSIFAFFYNNAFSYLEFLKRLFRILIGLYVLLFLKDDFDLEFAKKLLIYIGLFSAFYLFVQVVLYKAFGISAAFTVNGRQHGEYITNLNTGSAIYRPCAFFIEPGAFSHFLSFVILVVMFYTKKSLLIKFSLSAIFYFAIFLSTSTYGILLGAIIVFLGFVYNMIKMKKIVVLFIVLALLGIALLILFNMQNLNESSTLNYLVMKLKNISKNERFNTFSYYGEFLSGIRLILGIGIGNEEAYMASLGKVIPPLVNSFTVQLFSSGVIGVILLGALMLSWLFFSKKQAKVVSIYLIILSIGTALLTTYNVFFIMLFAEVCMFKETKEQYENIIC